MIFNDIDEDDYQEIVDKTRG